MKKRRETSGGMLIGALPIRDRGTGEVEKERRDG